MIIKKLTKINYNVGDKNAYEKRIRNLILIENKEYFYLDDLLQTKRRDEKTKLLLARNFYVKSGLIISVLDSDFELGHFSFLLNKDNGELIKNIEPKNKLINITYKHFVNKFCDNSHRFAFDTNDNYELKGREAWLENYNNWIEYYNKHLIHRM